MRNKFATLFMFITAAALSGCYQANTRLCHFDQSAGYRFGNCQATSPAKDHSFIVVCFSGGGTRAAAFSYGVLEAMHDTKIASGNQTLLDQVDLISSVSGGSITAAYYALNRQKTFSDFPNKFLYRNMQGALMLDLLNPYDWLRFLSPWFSRVELSAEYLNANVYDNKTFADVIAYRARPYVILNATDMSTGARFEFTQDQFDALYSDLSSYPIGRAVAASAAFPALLGPMTLKNYPRDSDYKEPVWVTGASQKNEAESDPRRYRDAQNYLSYSNGHQRAYIHLLDGGIADNVGARGPLQALTLNEGVFDIDQAIASGYASKVAFIVVNAKSDPDTSRDRTARVPGIIDVVMTAADVPIDNYTDDSVAQVHDYVNKIEQVKQQRVVLRSHGIKLDPSPYDQVELYAIDVSFDQMSDQQAASKLKQLGTNFHLSRADVDLLIKSGRDCLLESPDYQQLVASLDSNGAATQASAP